MLVSVCITTYNHAAFIEECLLSVLTQKTSFKYEICLGEDESNDGTRDICQKLAYDYPEKINLFLRERKDVHYIDGKATGRYNFYHTLKACKGKYIAIIDGDDYWCDELKLQKSVDVLEAKPSVSLVFHNSLIVNELGVSSGKVVMPNNFPEISGVEQLLKTNIATGSSLVMRWIDVSKFGDWFWKTTMGDWPVTLYALGFGDMYAIKEVMSCFRKHSRGVWSSKTNSEIHYAMAKSYKIMLKAGLFNGCNEDALHYYVLLLRNLESKSLLVKYEKKSVMKILKNKSYYRAYLSIFFVKLFSRNFSKKYDWLGNMDHLKRLKSAE